MTDLRTSLVAIYSFDIDHFKQVNDTFGHGVGDSILKIFSNRLKTTVTEIEKKFSTTSILSRPGGEEFELILIGNNHRTQLDQISELILKTIRTPAIPTTEEISEYSKGEGTTEGFPKRVLASIGVAHQSFSTRNFKIDTIIDNIRKKADMALYRAKSDGRDCVRYFDDIRLSHGRVIEYHAASDLMIIDIGTLVNVKRGDLYTVYFPPFTGDSECFIDDGRTKKRLGLYIAIESAQIRVLNTQENISTCMVISRQTDHPIPKGALLKRIPVGSKPSLIEPRDFRAIVKGRSQLIETVQRLLDTKSLLSVICIQPLINEIDLESNPQLLSDYITLIYMTFPAGTEVFAGDGNSFYVTMKIKPTEDDEDYHPYQDSEDDITDILGEQIESAILNIEKHTKSRTGVLSIASIPTGVDITATTAIHFARAALFAAQKAPIDKPAIRFFQPAQTLLAWKNDTYTDDAIADYIAFKSYGIKDAYMDNQLGLCILTADDIDKFNLAENAFISAHTQEPTIDIFAANAALVKARLKKYEDAYNFFKKIKAGFFENINSPSYLITYSKCALEVHKSGKDCLLELRELLSQLFNSEKYKAIKMQPIYETWMTELRKVELPT